MDYEFTGDFGVAPLGPFTAENKALVWPPGIWSIYDPDPTGKFFELVDDDRFAGRCCRMKYPEGKYGMGSQFYQLRIKSPGTPANIAFDWLAEDGFDFNPTASTGGKMGPCINWGEVGGDAAKRGTRPMWWYNAQGSNNAKPVFFPSSQDQRSGAQHIQPVVYTKPIECERIYRFQISIMGGPNGWTKHYQDGTQIAEVGEPTALQASESDDVLFDFAFFAGGGQESAPRWDSFARHGNIECWSGDPVAPPAPVPAPEPKPAGDGVTIEIDGVQYIVSGKLILTQKGGA